MRVAFLLAVLALTACASAPDMSRREAGDITRLAVIMAPHP
ncbi:hypothetical protein [Mesorhizobium sp.]|nr:hypothetical protein [Mesorhizobium sp.]